MKDKIVVAPHQISDYDLDIQSVGHNGAEEYIRKDALLEWAEEMKEQVGLGLNDYDMGEENGKADMLNALIDLLNKM